MDVPSELEFERLDDAEKYHRAVPGYMRRLRDVYEAVYERFGEAGLDRLLSLISERPGAIAMSGKLRGTEHKRRLLQFAVTLQGANGARWVGDDRAERGGLTRNSARSTWRWTPSTGRMSA